MAFNVTDVQAALKGADYPATGDELAALARDNGADQELVDALEGIGEVDGPTGVQQELKGDLTGADD
jgi:hypothetical protein